MLLNQSKALLCDVALVDALTNQNSNVVAQLMGIIIIEKPVFSLLLMVLRLFFFLKFLSGKG